MSRTRTFELGRLTKVKGTACRMGWPVVLVRHHRKGLAVRHVHCRSVGWVQGGGGTASGRGPVDIGACMFQGNALRLVPIVLLALPVSFR